MIPYIIIIIIIFLADRLSKWWMTAYLAEHGTVRVNDFITLYETYNRGVAFGMFQGIGPLVGWLTIGVLIGMFIYLIRLPRQAWIVRLGLAFIIGGACGNLIDRLVAGKVLDFITTPWAITGVFNVADIAINMGMIITLVGVLVQGQHFKEEEAVADEDVVSEPIHSDPLDN